MALLRKMTCNLRHPMGLRHPIPSHSPRHTHTYLNLMYSRHVDSGIDLLHSNSPRHTHTHLTLTHTRITLMYSSVTLEYISVRCVCVWERVTLEYMYIREILVRNSYSQSHLGWHFRKLKAQSSNVSFATFQWKETFELWALGFETAFENVTPSGIGCIYIHKTPQRNIDRQTYTQRFQDRHIHRDIHRLYIHTQDTSEKYR